MKYYCLLISIVFAGCQPNYTSGKTQCSDKNECPSGFICGNDGTSSVNRCFDNAQAACSTDSTFYCAQSDTCWSSPVSCSGGSGGVGGSGGAGGTGVVGTGGAGGGCGSGCPAGKQCYSGQCCVPPEAGGECTAFPACGCPAGQVCYPSSITEAMACVVGNNLPEGADCSSGSTCQTGFGCFGGVCKRYCGTDTDCPSVAGVQSCQQTTWVSDGSDILGVMACERICDPARPQNPPAPFVACPAGFNCSSDSSGVSYCFQSAPLPPGSTCSQEGDCAPGYYCTTSDTCGEYCLSNSDCSVGTTCQFDFSPSEYAGSHLVGYCN